MLITYYSYLYTLSVSLDGNFKLKRKFRSSKDPELSDGNTYSVNDQQYQAHLKELLDVEEVREPSSLYMFMFAHVL
jgi:hypothetical protein